MAKKPTNFDDFIKHFADNDKDVVRATLNGKKFKKNDFHRNNPITKTLRFLNTPELHINERQKSASYILELLSYQFTQDDLENEATQSTSSTLKINGSSQQITLRELNKKLCTGFKKNLKSIPIALFPLFFQACMHGGYNDQLQELMDREHSPFPVKVRQNFKKWMKDTPQISIQDTNDNIISPSATTRTSVNDLGGINIIDIEEIINHGDGDDLLSTVSTDKANTCNHTPEYRWKKILNTLNKIGIKNSELTAYHSQGVYLFDIHSATTRAQVLVEDYHEIFVIRDNEFSPDDFPLHKSPSSKVKNDREEKYSVTYLLDRRDVWKFKMHNDEQVTKDLKIYVLTPKHELKVQAKHKVSWADKGEMLYNSVIANVIATGDIPKTRDMRPIKWGKLANIVDATFAKARNALQAKTISLFKDTDIKSIHKIWDKAVRETPLLNEFLHASAPLTAEAVVEDLYKIYLEYNIIPEKEWFDVMAEDGITIAGHDPAAIEIALEYRTLPGYEDYLPNNVQLPTNLVEFQIQAGLITLNDEGQLKIKERPQTQQHKQYG